MHKMEELVKKLAGMEGKFYPVRADVSKEEDIISAFDWTKKNVGPIHILINNAGVAKCGLLLEGTTDDWRKILNLNVLGLSVATREAVKDMRENNIDGHIVHINSILGHGVFFVGMNVYPPSKFAVTALTETLRQELNSIGSKIKITVSILVYYKIFHTYLKYLNARFFLQSISPGYVNTELPDLSGLNTTFPGKLPILEADDVAQAVIFSLATPPHVQVSLIV